MHLFGHLDDVDVDWLATHGELTLLRDGQTLVGAGSQPNAVFVVLDGQVAVWLDQREVARLHAGEIVAAMSMLQARPASVSVLSFGRTRVLEVANHILEEQFTADPAFAARFLRGVATSLADRVQRLLVVPVEGQPSPAQLETAQVAYQRFRKLIERAC